MLLSNSSQNSRHRIHRHHRRHRHRRHLRFATGEMLTLLWGISPSPYSSRSTYDNCLIILSLILTDKVDPNSEQAIYWITGINLSTFSFSRSDDPDASGLVFVWPLISKSWIDRIARKIITSTLRWVSPTPWTTPSLSSTLMGKAAWQSRCKL